MSAPARWKSRGRGFDFHKCRIKGGFPSTRPLRGDPAPEQEAMPFLYQTDLARLDFLRAILHMLGTMQ